MREFVVSRFQLYRDYNYLFFFLRIKTLAPNKRRV